MDAQPYADDAPDPTRPRPLHRYTTVDDAGNYLSVEEEADDEQFAVERASFIGYLRRRSVYSTWVTVTDEISQVFWASSLSNLEREAALVDLNVSRTVEHFGDRWGWPQVFRALAAAIEQEPEKA